jgi:hypothetical protein
VLVFKPGVLCYNAPPAQHFKDHQGNDHVTIHYTTIIECTTLHYTTLHCTALHCTALHCPTSHMNDPAAKCDPRLTRSLPELAALKARLQSEGRAQDPALGAVFMTGSGSTLVGVGSDRAPAFLQEAQYKVRSVGHWGGGGGGKGACYTVGRCLACRQ